VTDRLFKPRCRVTIAVGSPIPGAWFTYLQDTIVIEGMRVKLQTEKHLGKKPNEATIWISNLNEATRAALKKRPLNVQLEVAYDTGSYAILFQGDVREDESKHEPPNWTTKIQLADGQRAIDNARVSAGLGGPVTGTQALQIAAASMGLVVPKNAKGATALVAAITNNGFTFHGPAQDVLTKVLDPSGLGWSIQDQQLQILGERDVIDGNGVVTTSGTLPAIVVSQATGMVGAPDYSVPKTLGKPPILKVKSQIDTRAVPGRLMQLVSETINGNFRIEDVKNVGDTHGRTADWFSEIQAKQL
jgi:hypothetical protein